jgi:hypothetical protein
VHHEYTSLGQTVNKGYYQKVLRHLRDAVLCKRQLHHDNPPTHSSHLIQDFLAKHGILQVCQAPYSPDMAPCDFWLFPRLKTLLKGFHFDIRERVRRHSCTPFQNKPSRSASSNGRTAGLSVWSYKGPTLKGISCCNHPDFFFFLAQCQILFGQASYIIKGFISCSVVG